MSTRHEQSETKGATDFITLVPQLGGVNAWLTIERVPIGRQVH